MSKNQSRKGYVVGALVALVSTLFTVAPAQADANGPVTLLPTSGTTFNTIIGSPIALSSSQDPSTSISGRSNLNAYYVITNDDEAEITIKYGAAPSFSTTIFQYYTYDADGYANTAATTSSGTVTITGAATSALTITTTESKIAVPAWAASGAYNSIQLDTTGDETVTLGVQTLVDYATGATLTTGLYNQTAFDLVSKEETVVIYAPGEVSATAKIVSLIPGGNTVSATVVYGNSVNPYFVAATTSLALFKDGSAQSFDTTSGIAVASGARLQGVITSSAGQSFSAGVISFGQSSSDLTNAFVDVLAGSATWSAGIYSAQAYYGSLVIGAASVVWDASAGPSSRVASVSPTFVNTLDANFSSSTASSTSELKVRSGTKTLSIGAQLYSTTSSVAASNVEVKAVVGGSLDATTTIAVTGAASTLVKGGSAITAFARTDAAGKVSFTITSTTGKKGDALSVTLYAKKSDGSWADMSQANGNSDIDVVWQDAVYSSFTAKPASYISGANPTVTFKVADQWGKGLDSIDGKVLTVYTEASFGGVAAPKSYSGTVVVSNGEAKFTFANFAPAGGLAQLKASLFQGAIGGSVTEKASTSVNVYNTAATDKVTVVDSFATAITYKDYVTGDTAVPAVATAVADAGLSTSEGTAISGNVLNTTGVGQPGVAVTVAAKGVLFYADGVYALDSITTNANEFGAFSVHAIAHTVNVKGTTVSITADGKTANTLLVTYLPDSLADENLKFSWTLPATVVKNTTYAVTLSLTDKWGNPVAGSTTSTNGAVSVQGLGSVQINSVDTAVNRNFDKNGQTTVFLRSVKDIAGPGSIVATLRTTGWTYPTGATGTDATLGSIGSFNTTNDKSTAWDESLWSNELTSAIEVLDSAPAAAGKVNVGSFNGKLVVYAAGLNGARISWKVGGNWGSAVATSNYAIFNRPTPRAGVTVSVEVFVNGVKTLTKSVVTR